MAEIFALDIETAPLPDAAEHFDEADVKIGNLKDPEKIEAKIKKAREEFVNRAALSWLTGRITCICLYNEEQSIPLYIGNGEGMDDEEGILRAFWAIYAGRRFVTYNGYSFDMQFIIMRSLVLGLGVDIELRGRKHLRNLHGDRHIDLINLFDSCGNWQGMGKVCKAILGEGKTGTGAEAIELFEQGKHVELAEYCMKDAELTWKLWQKIGGGA